MHAFVPETETFAERDSGLNSSRKEYMKIYSFTSTWDSGSQTIALNMLF